MEFQTLKSDLINWTEIEDVIIIVGKRIGLYKPDLKHREIPKFVLWSSSNDSRETEVISNLIFNLVELGALERRDDQEDMEIRWNPEFKLKWNKEL